MPHTARHDEHDRRGTPHAQQRWPMDSEAAAAPPPQAGASRDEEWLSRQPHRRAPRVLSLAAAQQQWPALLPAAALLLLLTTARLAGCDDAGWAGSPSSQQVAAAVVEDEWLTIDAAAAPEQTGLTKFWQASVGSGHARLGLRDDWRRQLWAVHEDTGIHGVRFHGSFDDDMGPVVTRGNQGQLKYNFTLLDQLYDGILAAGVRPIVEVR